MKLNIVKAGTGVQWVKLGIQTFLRQPLALTGLFFMFMAAMSVATLVPFIGTALALGLLPAATLGLMAATREATRGNFPMPSILITAFRAGRDRLNAMLVLGALYALGFLAVMGVSALVDGGKFASLYLLGGPMTEELVADPSFQRALWVAMALYLPLSLLFWHAPALVHWHGISPVKSLFFSLVACLRNFKAFTLYGLVWMGVFLAGGMVITLIAVLIGRPQVVGIAMVPAALLMASMFFTSVYFSYRDSFIEPGESDDTAQPSGSD
jgi:hypothetical protein